MFRFDCHMAYWMDNQVRDYCITVFYKLQQYIIPTVFSVHSIYYDGCTMSVGDVSKDVELHVGIQYGCWWFHGTTY